ncbi:MAG: response regulator [Candidatus Latescibacterota bacterium]
MEGAPSPPKVLIVDDTKTNIAILVQALRQDYKLGVATGGATALEYVRQHAPDLVLLDIMMPEMDGYEVCRRLKAEEATRRIPVIFITALDEVADKARGFALGAVDYITKPFEVVEVQARVRTHLQIVEYQRELEARNAALQKAQAQLRLQVRELEGRDALVHAQMSVASMEQAGSAILEVVARFLEAGQAVLYRPSAQGDVLEVAGMLGLAQAAAAVSLADGQALAAQAFRQRGPAQGSDGSTAAPLLYRTRVLGVLWTGPQPGGRPVRAAALEALGRLAGEAALVLHAAVVVRELERSDLDLSALLEMGDAE